MKIIESLNSFTIHKVSPTNKEPFKSPVLDLFRKAHNIRSLEDYSGVGTLFTEGSILARYFLHQSRISQDNVGYLRAGREAHSIAARVFDLTLGTILTSPVEALFRLAKMVHNLGKGILALVKNTPEKPAKEYFKQVITEFAQSIKSLVKAIPLFGSLINEYIFSTGRSLMCRLISPSAFNLKILIQKALQDDPDWADPVRAAIASDEIDNHFGLDESGQIKDKSARDAQELPQTPLIAERELIDPSLTDEERCFETSEVKRLVVAISSNINMEQNNESISDGSPMKTLEIVIKETMACLTIDPEILDFEPWVEGAFKITPNQTKAKLVVISFLLKKYPVFLNLVKDVKGVELFELMKGAIEEGSDDVFKWLITGVRKDEAKAQLDQEGAFNPLGALLGASQLSHDPTKKESYAQMFTHLQELYKKPAQTGHLTACRSSA